MWFCFGASMPKSCFCWKVPNYKRKHADLFSYVLPIAQNMQSNVEWKKKQTIKSRFVARSNFERISFILYLHNRSIVWKWKFMTYFPIYIYFFFQSHPISLKYVRLILWKGEKVKKRNVRLWLLVTPNKRWNENIAIAVLVHKLKLNEKQNWLSMTTDVFV